MLAARQKEMRDPLFLVAQLSGSHQAEAMQRRLGHHAILDRNRAGYPW